MNSNEVSVSHRLLDEILVAKVRIHGNVKDLRAIFAKLNGTVGDYANGNPIVIHHWGVSSEDGRHDMDVCLPITQAVEGTNLSILTLPAEDAMVAVHRGPYAEIGSTYSKISRYTYERGHPIAESTREVFHHLGEATPEETVVEIQVTLHDWINRFATKLEDVLGHDVKEKVFAPLSGLDIDTSAADRQKALCVALGNLENNSSADQQYEILSHCAHVYPAELIPPMRDLFRSTRDIDVVIKTMISKGGYYPKLLRREGSVIYSKKGPANPTLYEEAKTDAERRKAYCFCPMIRRCLEEAPRIFCNCAAGWPKQLWEGILERPLTIEIVQSLTNGDDECEFAIHLPEDIL
jgi:effector-binding domain-containing protein